MQDKTSICRAELPDKGAAGGKAYRNASSVLPEKLLREVQKYCDGELLYIPVKAEAKAEWGGRSGAREQYRVRNETIRRMEREGIPTSELAGMFFLSEDSIRKIIRKECH